MQRIKIGLEKCMQALSPRKLEWVIHVIERVGAASELNLMVPSWRTSEVVTSEFLLSNSGYTQSCGDHAIRSLLHIEKADQRQVWVAKLHNTVLDVDSSLLFARDRVIAQSGGATRSSRDAAFISGAYLRYRRQKPTILSGLYAPLDDVWDHYHLIVETLPRVLQIRMVKPETIFLSSQKASPAAKEIFERLRIPVTYLPKGVLVSGAGMMITEKPIQFQPTPVALDIVRETIISNFKHSDPRPPKPIYISRSHSSRSMHGEEILEEALEEIGVVCVNLQEMSFEEQIAYASAAPLIVGPHGAGLVNSIFQNPESSVLELSSGDRFEACYAHICSSLKLNYRFIQVDGSPDAPYGIITDEVIESVVGEIQNILS